MKSRLTRPSQDRRTSNRYVVVSDDGELVLMRNGAWIAHASAIAYGSRVFVGTVLKAEGRVAIHATPSHVERLDDYLPQHIAAGQVAWKKHVASRNHANKPPLPWIPETMPSMPDVMALWLR